MIQVPEHKETETLRLRDAGYVVHHKVLDSLEYGTPQSRKRVFIVAILKQCCKKPFHWPEAQPPVLARSMMDSDKGNVEHKNSGLPRGLKSMQRMITILDFMKEQKYNLRDDWFVDIDASPSRGPNLQKDRIGCLTRARAGSGGFWSTRRSRRMNMQELFRFQGFLRGGKELRYEGVPLRQVRLGLGNAWTLTVIKAILKKIMEALDMADRISPPA